MDKSRIFISHAASDAKYVESIKRYIEETIEGVSTFVASDPDDIASGTDWFGTIYENLRMSDAFILVLTSDARDRLWVGFELGNFWGKTNGKSIHCLYHPDAKIPSPLDIKQGKVVSSEQSLNSFFRDLATDVNREYQENHTALRLILKSIPRFDEFHTWKTYLRNRNGWNGRAIIRNDREVRLWTYTDDARYQIESVSGNWKGYDELWWAKDKGLNTDGSNPQILYYVNLSVSGSTLEQYHFYTWDNGHFFVPSPDVYTHDQADTQSTNQTYYCKDSLKYLTALVIADFGFCRNMERFADQCRIDLLDTSLT